ncbi:hypothetical protein [Clostridium estertheticum]|uniref:hypothetical protein n=1 Tax=Clostridium estertheticum TaxID=238834 RepID=UPI001C0B0E71|nr:hypothetical protein [Clostridium estertheticum]MBU3187215.1 hypothetical protein [Clostridium estertheticum]
MENDYTFPIVVRKVKRCLFVKFNDFDIEEQIYEPEVDYIMESKILLSNILLEYEQKKITIPIPKGIASIKISPNEKLIFINIWLPFYRTDSEKYVKKTLTIPSWIDELAKKQDLNFSHILKSALLEKLGLYDEIKKRKTYKFNKPMENLEDFLFIMQKMIKVNLDEENAAFSLVVNTKDFNLIVTTWTIWVNKNISTFLLTTKKGNIKKWDLESQKQEWLKLLKEFKIEFQKKLDKKCSDIIRQLRDNKLNESSIESLGGYISKLGQCLLNSSLKYDGIFERDESIYDYMRAITDPAMLKKNIKQEYWLEYSDYQLFTLQYKIEIPFLYVLVWNINNLYVIERFNYFNKKNNTHCKNICYECLTKISKTTLEILLGNSIFSHRLVPEIANYEKKVSAISQVGSINFDNYLPYLYCNEKQKKEYTDIRNKIVSVDVLTKLPMIPMYINKGDKVGLNYLVHSLCKEVENAD